MLSNMLILIIVLFIKNDEEDIDAEVTARKPGWVQVKENDRQDRQGAQRVDGPETMG